MSIEYLTDPAEQELIAHVRMMIASVRLGLAEKALDLEEIRESGHTSGFQAGQIDALMWVRVQLESMLAALGPFDDTRTCVNLLSATADMIGVIQDGTANKHPLAGAV